jgi:hypothetical protein
VFCLGVLYVCRQRGSLLVAVERGGGQRPGCPVMVTYMWAWMALSVCEPHPAGHSWRPSAGSLDVTLTSVMQQCTCFPSSCAATLLSSPPPPFVITLATLHCLLWSCSQLRAGSPPASVIQEAAASGGSTGHRSPPSRPCYTARQHCWQARPDPATDTAGCSKAQALGAADPGRYGL